MTVARISNLWRKITILIIICCCSLSAQAKYGGGTGEPNDPYLIFTAGQMNAIGADANWPHDLYKCFRLMADIDLSGYTGASFNIIGTGPHAVFTGIFDGNGHTISNFTYNSTYSVIGLFGFVFGSNAEIKNLGLIDPNVSAGEAVGSLVGYLGDGAITNCYAEGGSVAGEGVVGGLVGHNNDGTITNCRSSASVEGTGHIVGGLVGTNYVGLNSVGTITNCYSTGSISGISYIGGLVGLHYISKITNCYSTGSISGVSYIGGLVGDNIAAEITNCYSTGGLSGENNVGGLVGYNNDGTITYCYSTGSVLGTENVGGLVGVNHLGTISDCYLKGDVLGTNNVGGIVGHNNIHFSRITNSYSSGSASGTENVGGLAGQNDGTITNSYSISSVSGLDKVGGMVGWNIGSVWDSFWDIGTSGQTTSDGGTGLHTDEMQIASTFIDAGWDFNTPVWTIDDGFDYPRLWWEYVPVMHTEPEVTLGTSNTISWDPVPGANDFYAECAEDADFTSILYNTGWITETNYTFTDLELGKRYWYTVKARSAEGVESQWSNVEYSLQCTLADAVDIELELDSLKNENAKNALLNKIDAALKMIDQANYTGALSKLEQDILQKTNGCAETGESDKNDWILTCEQQNEIYPLIRETIEHVKALMAE